MRANTTIINAINAIINAIAINTTTIINSPRLSSTRAASAPSRSPARASTS